MEIKQTNQVVKGTNTTKNSSIDLNMGFVSWLLSIQNRFPILFQKNSAELPLHAQEEEKRQPSFSLNQTLQHNI